MDMSPKQIVEQLDRYIIGQDEAKKAVAIALRNRYRRSKLPDDIKGEITPKNIIMKGPTGVGKTEIARRLAKLVKAPFIKVEATKFTEVGYVGRDVESMIRDLAETSVRLVKEEKMIEVQEKAAAEAERKIAEALLVSRKKQNADTPEPILKDSVYEDLRSGKLDNRNIEIEVDDTPKAMELVPGSGTEINIGEIMGGFFPKKRKKRKMTVKEALHYLTI